MTIEILLVDDRRFILESMKIILRQEPEIKIVGTAQDGQSAIAQVIKLQPDVVLIDIEMPKMNGIVATKYICQNIPNTRVIVLTSHKEQSYIDEALQAGASGYLFKDTLIQDLKQAIYSLGRGNLCTEAKLSIQDANRIQTTNITKYQEKITYLKKYGKSIYKPTLKKRSKIKPRGRRKIKSPRSSNSGINRATLAPIFELSTTSDLLTSNHSASQKRPIYTQPQYNRQRYLRRIVLMLLALASFVLAIIIF